MMHYSRVTHDGPK